VPHLQHCHNRGICLQVPCLVYSLVDTVRYHLLERSLLAHPFPLAGLLDYSFRALATTLYQSCRIHLADHVSTAEFVK
jgi:hypothetical protein